MSKIVPQTLSEREINQFEIEKLHDFYSVVWNGAECKDLRVNKYNLIERFKVLGFYRYDNEGESVLVHIDKGVIEPITKEVLKDRFFAWVEGLPVCEHKKEGKDAVYYTDVTPKMISNKLLDGIQLYFSTELLNRCVSDDVKVNRDDEDTMYFYYKNGFTRITKKGVEFLPYSELGDKLVFKSKIHNRDYVQVQGKGQFEQFIENITQRKGVYDEQRKMRLMSLLGYLMHGFVSLDVFSVLFTDADITDDDCPNGRTGKTLLGKALGHMINANKRDSGYLELNGKDWTKNDQHRYSLANLDTQLVHVNDLKRHFKVEEVFNDVSDGFSVRKLYQQPFKVQAKMMFSSNMAVQLNGSSAKDRVKVFEIANYYSDKLKPRDEFGGLFFDSKWSDQEWSLFYNFMQRCGLLFLSKGICESEEVNYSMRELISGTSGEFVEWFEEVAVREIMNYPSGSRVTLSKKELLKDYQEVDTDFAKGKGRIASRFSRWIDKWATFNKVEVRHVKNRENEVEFFIK